MLARFCLYGFIKNQKYYEPFLYLAFLEKGLSFTAIGLLIGFRAVCTNLMEVPTGAMADALGCYTTYQEMIEKTGVKEKVGDGACFEIFQEDHKPPLSDLFVGLS